jgi:pimeloyl-ACP methyl ester carboxylesterase
MNRALADERRAMDPALRARLDSFEAAGLFGKGEPWERGRYPAGYMTLAWGNGYFPYLYQRRPDPNYDPAAAGVVPWDLYREMWGSDGEFVIDGNLAAVEYTDRLASLHVPTLIICGDHDECPPVLSEAMHARIAGSRIVVLPQSGHLTFVDQPTRFLRAVDGFLHGR